MSNGSQCPLDLPDDDTDDLQWDYCEQERDAEVSTVDSERSEP